MKSKKFDANFSKRHKMQKSISFDDVIKYVNIAPEGAIREIFQICSKRLSMNVGDDSDAEGEMKVASSGDLMAATLSELKTSSALSGPSLLAQLQKKVESEDELEAFVPPPMKLKLKVVGQNKQYSTTDCEVVNANDKEVLDKMLAACEKVGGNCAYGKGTSKTLLRISKCSSLNIGKTVEQTVRFSSWSRDGKKGISAYLGK